MIAIIGAMEEEVSAILTYLEDEEIQYVNTIKFIIGKLSGKNVVICTSGIGKVNASITTTVLLTNFDINLVINIGSAGGLDDSQQVGDIVISTGVAAHDVDLTAFGRQVGELPGLPAMYLSDYKLAGVTANLLNAMNLRFQMGAIVSGDQFISKETQVAKIIADLPSAVACEMEAASIAQVCYRFNKKFVIMRSISDVYSHKNDSTFQFDKYLKKASANSAKICAMLIKNEQ